MAELVDQVLQGLREKRAEEAVFKTMGVASGRLQATPPSEAASGSDGSSFFVRRPSPSRLLCVMDAS